MTSMPASRSARAMIFAPRSCPSSPGFATTTRILRSAMAGDSRAPARRPGLLDLQGHRHVGLVDRADDLVRAALAHPAAVAARPLERRLEARRPTPDDDVVLAAAPPVPPDRGPLADRHGRNAAGTDEVVVADLDVPG